MQQDVNDHEPEFVSLKREVVILCDGPSTEPSYFKQAASLCVDASPPGRDLDRPGQLEQDHIIVDYENRLKALREKLNNQSAQLGSQLKRGQEFESLTSGLSTWMSDVEKELDGLKIRDPNSDAIRSQLQKCQVCGYSVKSFMH